MILFFETVVSLFKFQPGGTGSLNGRERSAYNNVNNKVTKFQHIQRKWGGLLSPPPPSPTTMVASPSSPFCGDRLVSETEESDMDNPMGGGGGPPTPKSPHKFAITSGSQTVKSLTNRYEDFMGETKGKYNVTLKCSHLASPSSDRKKNGTQKTRLSVSVLFGRFTLWVFVTSVSVKP